MGDASDRARNNWVRDDEWLGTFDHAEERFMEAAESALKEWKGRRAARKRTESLPNPIIMHADGVAAMAPLVSLWLETTFKLTRRAMPDALSPWRWTRLRAEEKEKEAAKKAAAEAEAAASVDDAECVEAVARVEAVEARECVDPVDPVDPGLVVAPVEVVFDEVVEAPEEEDLPE